MIWQGWQKIAQSGGTMEYTDYIPQSVPDMTLNTLMVKLQWFWSFVECGVPLDPLFPGPRWPGMVGPDRVLSMGRIELFEIKVWTNDLC